jgi:hypothetical protein
LALYGRKTIPYSYHSVAFLLAQLFWCGFGSVLTVSCRQLEELVERERERKRVGKPENTTVQSSKQARGRW